MSIIMIHWAALLPWALLVSALLPLGLAAWVWRGEQIFLGRNDVFSLSRCSYSSRCQP